MVNARLCKGRPTVEATLVEVRQAIAGVVWPPGAAEFTIYPQSGKRSDEGNGVAPIKTAFVLQLTDRGWVREQTFPLAKAPNGAKFGALDAARSTPDGVVAVEWETGNISSSHRALNKMAFGISRGKLLAGVLIVPTKELAQFLTDRIGNVYELRSYIEFWRSVPIEFGYLGIFTVEHDATSMTVPRIVKGTDGRALK